MPRAAFRLLLALSFGLLLTLGVSFFVPAARQPTAMLHPEVPSLLHSTGGLSEQPETLWLGFAIGLLMIALMAVCVWIGLRREGKGTPLSRWMMIGFVGYGAVFTAMCAYYHLYTSGHAVGFFGGFPAPTAWMIYGMWLFPLLFVALFLFQFDRWIFSEADLKRFQDLVREGPSKEGGAA